MIHWYISVYGLNEGPGNLTLRRRVDLSWLRPVRPWLDPEYPAYSHRPAAFLTRRMGHCDLNRPSCE